ncbi:MAG: hypothetical protein ABIQ49_06975, partial [Gemmatimonadales bacterium]
VVHIALQLDPASVGERPEEVVRGVLIDTHGRCAPSLHAGERGTLAGGRPTCSGLGVAGAPENKERKQDQGEETHADQCSMD